MKSRVTLAMAILFWVVVGILVVRTNRLLFGPVSFAWHNLRQPNATFRWSTAPTASPVVIPAESSRSMKITVPMKFSQGVLLVGTDPSQGSLTIDIAAPVGQPDTTRTIAGGEMAAIPLSWDAIAIQTRTFNVDLVTHGQPIAVSSIRIRLQ